MTDERVHAIFLQVCDLPPEERARRLDELCVDDSTLRGRVESLLKHDAADDDLLGDSAMESGEPPVARLLAGTPGEARDAPERIAGFRILAKIGEGGMGTVYAAEQEHPRRRVALKMIRPGVMTEVLRKRFRAEAEMLGRLQHPGIAQIHEAGEVDTGNGRRPYFAMEYVEGRDLRRHARDNDLGVPERLELVSRVADAVHHAHSRGVIHRDLKPENVLVSEEPAPTLAGVPARFAGLGQPKVLDFGVARACDSDQQLTTMHTMAGEILGTLTYMSPEQIAGRHEEVDERSDVYALGVILYELLAGRPPCDFRSLTIVQAARVAAESDPLRLGSVDSAWRGDIETIVGKALEKEPGRRYESAAELATDLRRHLTNEPIAARRPSASYQVRKFARRHRGLVAGLAAAFAILVAGVVTTSVLAVRASRNARVAEEQRRQARAEAYRFSLAAVEALGTNDPARALHHLEGAPEEYRGWEWAFLRARLLSHDILLRGDAACEWAHGFARDPGGRLKALLRRGGALEIVDVLSGAVERRVAVDAEPTVPVLSPDGSRLAVWFESLTRLDVWDLESGRRLFEHPVTISPDSAPSFDASGRRLVVPTEGEITTLDAGTGEVLMRQEESRIPQHVALHPGGEGLACSVASRG
ncbi:MAG: serine/threonine-protein kinase, partial [Planctomycetota bacterium]